MASRQIIDPFRLSAACLGLWSMGDHASQSRSSDKRCCGILQRTIGTMNRASSNGLPTVISGCFLYPAHTAL